MPKGVFVRKPRRIVEFNPYSGHEKFDVLRPKPKPPEICHSFSLEAVPAEGMTLYKVVMYVSNGTQILRKMDLSHPDIKASAVRNVHQAMHNLYFEEKVPKSVEERANV